MTNKNSLNNTISKVCGFILWIVLIFVIISSFILWKKTNNRVFIISGFICALGVLLNIRLLLRTKSEKKE